MRTEITIPENLNEITLGQYQHFLKASKGLEGDTLAQRTVNILCDIKLSDIMILKLKDVREISAHLNELFSITQDLQPRFTIKGKGDVPSQEFGFIRDLEDISFGEYVDLDGYLKDDTWNDTHKAMAVLFRPIKKIVGDKYTIVDYEGTNEYADIMRFMPLGVALGALVFFYHLGNDLLKATRNYLMSQMKELTLEKQPNSIKTGDGTTVSTPSLVEMLEHLTKLPDFELPKHLHI